VAGGGDDDVEGSVSPSCVGAGISHVNILLQIVACMTKDVHANQVGNNDCSSGGEKHFARIAAADDID
jgi:hypothetical protein